VKREKVVIVTGGVGDLGMGISRFLLQNGFTVVIFDINQKKLDDIDNKYIKYCVDITDYDSVENIINEIIIKYKSIDVLVNNAGVIYSEPFINIMNPKNMKHSYESFQKNLNINLNSVFIMTSNVVEKMVLKRTKGVIINISSISANGNAGQTAYSAAKGAVNAMTKTWAKELGSFGIRSVAISPGFINTDSTSHALNDKIIKHIKSSTPLKRLGNIDNISDTVLYIINNEFINGTVIEVDGGLTL